LLDPAVNAPKDDLVVVGIGASAGGVEALCEFFKNVPADVDAAFLVVTHLGPHRESKLNEILTRCTDFRVVVAEDNSTIERGHVYVLSAESIVTVVDRRLLLREVEKEHRERNPIDVCFASLARDVGENAVGIILSGVGVDGTVGTKAIKEAGGFTIAQANFHGTPQHRGMPMSAVKGGFVDVSAPVHEIGLRLADYLRSAGALGVMADESNRQLSAEARNQALKEICDVLRNRVGHDFQDYKEKTFVRRIQRRMQMLQIAKIEDYSKFLGKDADEPSHLFRDLLISVTSFFRDNEAFTAIEKLVIPRLMENATAQDTIRVWVPGCATGEEAYSLAIMFREQMKGHAGLPRVQIFATDIDDDALAAARSGRYPAALLEGMRADRLQTFFRAEPASYVVTKEVRDLCIFSSHSVIRDPPFSRMDFVSCRNLLIYFNADLQDSVLPIIHYALKPHGFLFLGPSENISRHSQLFATVEKKHRIFQRRTNVSPSPVPTWISRGKGTPKGSRSGEDVLMHRNQRVRQMIEDRVLEGFSPAHIVVDAEGDILFYSSRTGKYLEPQVGSPSRQLLSMARRGLRLELRAALREAVERRQTVVRERLEVEVEDRIQPVRLTVEPLRDSAPDPLFLVVFTDIGPTVSREDAASSRHEASSHDLSQLEDELKETRDRLQSTIEEYETALEELKSGNEELVSVNEELQSTNEELETSKEELQSVNEELHTVNSELAARVDDLHRANADMRNLFESTQVATVFLDHQMLIRSYTPAVTGIFNLITSDRGRPITDIAHNLDDVDFRRDVRRVLEEHTPLERSVQQRDSKVFHLMRILPYRTADGSIDGALITFVDVTAVIAAEEQQRLLVRELNHRVRNMLQVVIGLANQTLHRSTDVGQFEKAFLGRMQALAKAYELLSREGWQKVPMCELLESQLAPFATHGRRYSAEGPVLVLKSAAALSLGLVFYELATNATKYGAFTTPEGQVRVSWALDKSVAASESLYIRWTETGGPRVLPPTRKGFGTELVQRQLKYELAGQASMDFDPSGLCVEMRIPADEALEGHASAE
jgi:two-component system, chemotaxis family, CheB/CheR fusion protein